MKRKPRYPWALSFLVFALLISGCGSESSQSATVYDSSAGQSSSSTISESDSPTSDSEESGNSGSRGSTLQVLTPEAPGTETYDNESASIDTSNSSEGYIMARYFGENEKVKLQITGPSSTTYTYNLKTSDYEAFPLSEGSGDYTVAIYENISDNQYSTCLSQTITADIEDEFKPFLYPNQYCWFTESSSAVAEGAELAASTDSDLDVVDRIYNYVIDHVTYDYDLASDLESGYIPDPDSTLASGTGICLDYASLMVCMLRSQGIPTHLEVGYAGEAYHAWVSVYITDVGWINGMIQFDGSSWEIMDPTFAANSSEKALKNFIGEGDNYVVKYVY